MNTLLTTIGEGLPVEVSFDYDPGCKAVMYGDNVHPEVKATIDITKIVVATGTTCIMDTLNQDALDKLEAECWDLQNTVDDDETVFISRGEYLKL